MTGFNIGKPRNPFNTKEIAHGVDSIMGISDAGVRVPDKKVAIPLHLPLVDRFVVRKPDFKGPTVALDGAIFGFRLPRLVKLDRKVESQHFLAEINPL